MTKIFGVKSKNDFSSLAALEEGPCIFRIIQDHGPENETRQIFTLNPKREVTGLILHHWY